MTTHYEVASARDTAVEAVQPGTKLGADPLAQPALVFRSDEVFLVAGTPAELLAFTDRARVAAASLAGGGRTRTASSWWSSPTTPTPTRSCTPMRWR